MPTLVCMMPPVPVVPLKFEEVFPGNYTHLITLTDLRRDAMRRDADTETIRAYVTAWRAFIAPQMHAGSSAHTMAPFVVEWSVKLWPEDIEYTVMDASPVLESVCATLVLIAACMRDGNWAAARDEIAYVKRDVLSLFVPFNVEAQVLSPILFDALDAACRGQVQFDAALDAVAAEQSSETVAAAFYDCADVFAETMELLPATGMCTVAYDTALAMCHRFAAVALLESPVDAHRAVAVALAARAAAALPRNDKLSAFASELARRSTDGEFGMHPVPRLVHVARGDTLSATCRDDKSWDVTV